jgi:uncharacterized protein YfaA (DUF2138 family)
MALTSLSFAGSLFTREMISLYASFAAASSADTLSISALSDFKASLSISEDGLLFSSVGALLLSSGTENRMGNLPSTL